MLNVSLKKNLVSSWYYGWVVWVCICPTGFVYGPCPVGSVLSTSSGWKCCSVLTRSELIQHSFMHPATWKMQCHRVRCFLVRGPQYPENCTCEQKIKGCWVPAGTDWETSEISPPSPCLKGNSAGMEVRTMGDGQNCVWGAFMWPSEMR